MSKKPSPKGPTKKGKARRKLTDLGPKRVKGGDAASIKGGFLNRFEKWIEL